MARVKGRKVLEGVSPGDLVLVEWSDASIGSSLSAGSIEVPVKSVGIFLDVISPKKPHILLAQNIFHITDRLRDIDYTAIPLSWATKVRVIAKRLVDEGEAEILLRNFVSGRRRTLRRRMMRVENHGRLGQEDPHKADKDT